MSVVNVITQLLIDGHPTTDNPFTTTVVSPQWQTLNVVKSQDEEGVYNLVPTVAAFPIIEAILLFNVDQDVTYMLQGQTTSCIPVCAGGLLMLLNPNIDVERLNLRVNNPDGPGQIVGFVAGKGVPLNLSPAMNMVIDERWETTTPPPPVYPVPTVLVIDERWEGTTTEWLLYDRSNPSNVYQVIFHGPSPDSPPNQIEVIPSSGPATGGILLNPFMGGGPNWSYFINNGQSNHDHNFFADQIPWDNSHTFYVDDATEQLIYFP